MFRTRWLWLMCAVLAPPAYEPIATFPVRVHEGMVQVKDDRWD